MRNAERTLSQKGGVRVPRLEWMRKRCPRDIVILQTQAKRGLARREYRPI